GARHAARRLLHADLSPRLRARRRSARANPARRHPGAGADRPRHAVDGRHRERRGVLLYFPAQRTNRLHAAEGRRSAGGRRLFRQEPARRAPRQLRPAGRQDFRLRQPHHADRRPGTQLPHLCIQDLQPEELTADRPSPTEAQCASTASSSSATMLVILIIGLTAGPAVSLYGSPTVSPVTAALWASEPLPP